MNTGIIKIVKKTSAGGNMKGKLLILGSDFSTVHLAEEAHRMGLYVIVSDLMRNSPTKSIADETWDISTTGICELRARILEHRVDGVLAGASEFNLENVREICKQLNMPLYCISNEAWSVARNKRKFKDICIRNGVRVADDYFLSDDLNQVDLSKIRFPVVVKPVDKSGNRGMSYCNTIEELKTGCLKVREISDNESIIVERRLRGPEYTAYYVLAEGEIVLSYYTSMHHEPGEADNIYSLEYMTSCHLKQFLSEMNDGLIAVLKDAGCKDGIAWVETMYDQDGHFYALEMGYRFAGPGIYPVHERITGFNTYKWMIELALGKKHTCEDLPLPLDKAYVECGGAYDLFANCNGIISKIIGLNKVQALSNAVIDMPKREGDSVRKYSNMGIIKIYGKNCDEMCDTIAFINTHLKILDSDGNNMFIIFDDFDIVKNEYENGLAEFRT